MVGPDNFGGEAFYSLMPRGHLHGPERCHKVPVLRTGTMVSHGFLELFRPVGPVIRLLSRQAAAARTTRPGNVGFVCPARTRLLSTNSSRRIC